MILIITLLTLVIFGAKFMVNGEVKSGYNVLIALSFLILSGFLTKKYTQYETKVYVKQLECLKDNSYIHGSIHIGLGSGSGRITQDYQYTMYFATQEGAKLISIPARKTIITYSDKHTLEIYIKEPIRAKGWKALFYLPNENEVIKYNINIPKTAIDNSYILDTQ